MCLTLKEIFRMNCKLKIISNIKVPRYIKVKQCVNLSQKMGCYNGIYFYVVHYIYKDSFW